MPIPADIDQIIERSWLATEDVPGFLGENEARFLGLAAALTPAPGVIVEIGSFKGRSTVMLAKVAAHYGLGPVVAIDPHTHDLTEKDGAPPQLQHHRPTMIFYTLFGKPVSSRMSRSIEPTRRM